MFRSRSQSSQYDAGVPLRDRIDHESLLATRDAEAEFTSLYRIAYSPVRCYLQRMVGFAEADDLVADVFATAWSRWTSVPPGPDRQFAWVFGVAHFKVREAIRDRQRFRGLVQRITSRRIEASVDGPEDVVVALQRAHQILDLLSAAERDAVALTVLGGLSSKDAAQVLGCSVSAVTSRVSRARRRLAELMSMREEVSDEAR